MADAAGAPTDALGLLGAALQAHDGETERRNLEQLLLLLQAQPGNIPPILPYLLPMLHQASESLKKWIVDVIDLTFCKPTIGPQARSSLAYHMPEPILGLLNDSEGRYAKVAITAFASCYQPLFRLLITDPTQGRLWPTIEAIKQRILVLFESTQRMGIKLAAIKAFQKIVLVQSRAADARGQPANRSSADANIAQVPADHAVLHVASLEQEANDRIKQILTIIFVSSSPDLVMASMNCLSTLAKMRPTLSPIVFEALISWTPSALTSLPYVTVRSVETTLRLLFQHFHPRRNSLAGPYAAQIVEAVETQRSRMEAAAREEHARKEREGPVSRMKRVADDVSAPGKAPAKRKKVRFAELEDESSEASTPSAAVPQGSALSSSSRLDSIIVPALQSTQNQQGDPLLLAEPNAANQNPMASFDATTLPLPLVIDLIMANLGEISDANLDAAIARARARINGDAPPAQDGQGREVEEEVAQDPLKVDMGEEEETFDAAAERQLQEMATNEEEQSTTALSNFSLKAPSELSMEECSVLLRASIDRICQSGAKEAAAAKVEAAIKDAAEANDSALTTQEMASNAQLWTVLVTRLATRGFAQFDGAHVDSDSQEISMRSQADAVRELMLKFVVSDFPRHHTFALQWMAEEFHSHSLLRKQRQGSDDEQRDDSSPYTIWLQRIVASVIDTMEAKDKTLHEFLNRVPLLTASIVRTIQSLCLNKAKMAIGFTMLRDLALRRLPARTMIGEILLDLTRNEEKTIRGAAIITVRNWVRVNGQGTSPAGPTLEQDVLDYAKGALKRLTVRQSQEGAGLTNGKPAEQNGLTSVKEEQKHDGDGEGEHTPNGEAEGPTSALDSSDAEVRLDTDVVRLVELPFALCVRRSEMLDEVFAQYASMPSQVQEAVEKHITPLVQNLGANNNKLLSLIKNHPEGTDSLAVRVFNILGERNRSKKLVDLAKEMAEEHTNEIDPRFLIPILPDLEKAEIIKYLPRVVSILSSEKAEDRTMLKNVFTSIVQPPEQGFGSVSTNLPRARQSELLSAVELMSLLHHAEPEIGRKTAADAIRICFGMTDIFRSEVIGAVLNRLIEEPELPVLFMRTAIIAVRTYKSLSSYISTIFLSRLITKKVWQQPVLWDGFKICAKQTAPASFGALIQLPREQLRDVIASQPDLRTGLREYLVKKAGGNKARLKIFLESLGDGEEEVAAATAAATPPTGGAPHLQDGVGSGTSTPVHMATSTPTDG